MKRANLAKAVYDMAKVSFAGLAIGPLLSGQGSVLEVASGALATVLLLTCAWLLDKEES